MTDTLSAINIDQLTSSAMNAFTGNIEPVRSDSNQTDPVSKSIQNLAPVSSAPLNRVVLPPISLIKKSRLKSHLQPIAPKTTNVLDINRAVSLAVTAGLPVFGSNRQESSNQVSEILNLQQHQANSSQTSQILTPGENPVTLHTGSQILSRPTPGGFSMGQQEPSSQYPGTLHVQEQLSSSQSSENLNTGKQGSALQTVAILNGCHVVSAGQYGSHSFLNANYDHQDGSLHPVSVTDQSLSDKRQEISSLNENVLTSGLNADQSMNDNSAKIQQMRDSHMVTAITQQISHMGQVQESLLDKQQQQMPVPESQSLSHPQLISFGNTKPSADNCQNSVSAILTSFNSNAQLQESLSSCYSRAVVNHPSNLDHTSSIHETIHLGSLGNSEDHQSSNTEGMNLDMNETLPNSQPIDLSNFNVQDAVAIHLSNQDLNPVDSLTDPVCGSQAIVQDLYLTRPAPDSNPVNIINQTSTEQNVNQLQDDTVQVDERAIRSIQDYLTIHNLQSYITESEDNVNQTVPGNEAILHDQLALKMNGISMEKDAQSINRKVLESVLKIVERQQQSQAIVTETSPTSQSVPTLDTASVVPLHQSASMVIAGSVPGNQSVSTLDNASVVPLHQSTSGIAENLVSNQLAVNTQRVLTDSGQKISNTATMFTHYCIECRMSLLEPCPYHNTQNHTHIMDSPILPYSQLSLPCVLYLRQSSTSTLEQSYGVWSRTKILPNTKFGPMQGKFVDTETQEKCKGYFPVWKIFQEESCDELSMTDESLCNWLMYLRPARSENTQNILTHQIGAHIYFFAIKEILPEEELLFWYSKEYAKVIGVPVSPNQMKINECLLCGKLFRSKKFLTMHEREIHPNENPKRFHCEVCNHRFTSLAKLNIHTASHTGVKPHACGICGKRFNDPSNLRAHAAIHTGVKDFKCTTCGKGFRQKAHLQAHMIIHTGKKNFYCEFCGKYFARQSDLKTHTYSHTQEKTYICPCCNKYFYKSQNYKRHMYIHSGERNFICDLCSKTFYTKYHRDRHFKTCKGPRNGFSVSNDKDITVNNEDGDWTSGPVATKQMRTGRKTGVKKISNNEQLGQSNPENINLCM